MKKLYLYTLLNLLCGVTFSLQSMEKPVLEKGPVNKNNTFEEVRKDASLLCEYAAQGNAEGILHLVKVKKLSVNARVFTEKPPLYFAVMNKRVSIVTLLLHLGARKEQIYSFNDISECLNQSEYQEVKHVLEEKREYFQQIPLEKILEANKSEVLMNSLASPRVAIDSESSKGKKTESLTHIPNTLDLIEEEIPSLATLSNLIELLKPRFIQVESRYETEIEQNQRLSDQYIATIKSKIKQLFERQPSLKCGDADVWSPLHAVIDLGCPNPDIISFLLEQGVPLDARDHGGCTPLYRALQYGYNAAANMLLLYGADTQIQSRKRKPHEGDELPTTDELLFALVQKIGEGSCRNYYPYLYRWYRELLGVRNIPGPSSLPRQESLFKGKVSEKAKEEVNRGIVEDTKSFKKKNVQNKFMYSKSSTTNTNKWFKKVVLIGLGITTLGGWLYFAKIYKKKQLQKEVSHVA